MHTNNIYLHIYFIIFLNFFSFITCAFELKYSHGIFVLFIIFTWLFLIWYLNLFIKLVRMSCKPCVIFEFYWKKNMFSTHLYKLTYKLMFIFLTDSNEKRILNRYEAGILFGIILMWKFVRAPHFHDICLQKVISFPMHISRI